jgi:NTP pyrophosphatase (non-canonical NTP hydrolase)
MDIYEFSKRVHQTACDHGFWDGQANKAEKIALMHSELSECLEGVRKPGPDKHCPEFTQETVELADAVIRILDYVYHYGLRLEEALVAKATYNESRPYKHGKAF